MMQAAVALPAAPAVARPTAERWSLRELALLGAVVLLLVPNFTSALHWGDQFGGSPVKPRDYNILFTLVSVILVFACRPAFCFPALALGTIPLLRLLDAAFLQRYNHIEFGGHSIYVMMLAGYLIVTIGAILSLNASKGREIAVWVAAITIAVNSAVNLYEYLGFAHYTRIPGRMSGFHVDPNHSPIINCLMLGILFTLNPRYWWNMLLVLVSALGIALTMSRSGMAVFAAMTGIYVLLHFRERIAGMLGLAVVALPVLVVGIGIMGASSTKQGIVKNEDTSSRMQAIYELDFEKLKSPERAKDLADGWEAVTLKPFLGWGTGAGGLKWQPHNMFVTQWIDLGLPGLFHYVGALLTFSVLCAFKRFRGGFCLMPVWLFIPCSQVLLETPAYWYSFAVAALVLFPKRFRLVLQSAPRTAASQPAAAHA